MDIKAKIEEIVDKIKGDKDLTAKFEKDPVGAVEGLVGVDLPDDQLQGLVEGIKAKLGAGKVGDLLGGLLGKK